MKLPVSSIFCNSRQILFLKIVATNSAYTGHWEYKSDFLFRYTRNAPRSVRCGKVGCPVQCVGILHPPLGNNRTQRKSFTHIYPLFHQYNFRIGAKAQSALRVIVKLNFKEIEPKAFDKMTNTLDFYLQVENSAYGIIFMTDFLHTEYQ